MPPFRLPPTPASSTDIAANEKLPPSEMESVFSLPPPAWQSNTKKLLRKDTQTSVKGPSPPSSSPNHKPSGARPQRKRTLSGSAKSKTEPPSPSFAASDAGLPPPPSRARKIIQMKPKPSQSKMSEDQASSTGKAAPNIKEISSTSGYITKRKQTQPCATSAAGRKIARKTAHSIIERRRRSKMNEEFGVLKDMIPACAGVEMHKLAILQAGIEYVKYLEGCIEQLKGQNEEQVSRRPISRQGSFDEEDEDAKENDDSAMHVDQAGQNYVPRQTASTMRSESSSSSPSLMMRLPAPQTQQPPASFRQSSIVTSASNSTYAPPNLRLVQSSSSVHATSIYQTSSAPIQLASLRTSADTEYSVHPPPYTASTPSQTGVSPAFGALNFSPDLSRTSPWSSVNASKLSPDILPLPHSAIPLSDPRSAILQGFDPGEGHAEATATAALMMMTKDRRGSIGTPRSSTTKGMSVRDLLAS